MNVFLQNFYCCQTQQSRCTLLYKDPVHIHRSHITFSSSHSQQPFSYVAIHCSRFDSSLYTLDRILFHPPYYPTPIVSLHTTMDAHLCIKVHRVFRELNLRQTQKILSGKPFGSHMFQAGSFPPPRYAETNFQHNKSFHCSDVRW